MDKNNFDLQAMMSSLLQNTQKFQETLTGGANHLGAEYQEKIVEGKAGGELVCVQVNLKLEVVKIEVKPELWAEKPEVVIELMVAAINQGLHLAKEGAKQAMLEASKNMGFPFAK